MEPVFRPVQRGSEDPRGKGDILCMDKEEFDHGSANRLRVRVISAQKSSGENTEKGDPVEILETAGAGCGRGEPETLKAFSVLY